MFIKMNILEHNRQAWDKEVSLGNKWTQPVSNEEVEKARNGILNLLLTPLKKVPALWLGNVRDKRVLCLAGGGGQQGPLLAAAGAQVVVFDNSPAQLEQDIAVAEKENFELKTMQGDMRDLSFFNDESFDLIFHPVSNCFIDNIIPVWKECYRVLKPGGTLLSGFCNPITFIFDYEKWDKGELQIEYTIPYSDIRQLPKDMLAKRVENKNTLEFGHTLEDQIGGQIEAGFVISGFYEDYAGDKTIDKHIMTFAATRALKLK